MQTYQLQTKRGYIFSEVSSAMQKAIRRGDTRIAGYFAIELFESGYFLYLWKRLLTISAEDCADIITLEVESLHNSFKLVNEKEKRASTQGRVFIAKAVIILCAARKCRDADHLTNLVYDKNLVAEKALTSYIEDAKNREYVPLPGYSLDVHTAKGKRAGKTKKDFLIDEHDALKPRQAGLFDDDLEAVRKGKVKVS